MPSIYGMSNYKIQGARFENWSIHAYGYDEVENLDNAEITDALSNANSITINQDEITAVSSNKSRIAVGFESGLLLHTDAVSALVFYNSTIYSTGMDKKLICYDYDSKNLLYSIEFTPLTPNPAFGFCIDAREGFVAVGRGDGVVTLVQIKSRNTKVVTHLEGHTWCVMGVKFYKYYLISAGLDGRVIVWRIKDGSIVDQTQLGVKIDALSILSDGQVLVGGVSKEDERHGRVHIIKFKCL